MLAAIRFRSSRQACAISIYDAARDMAATDSVRNGNRWPTVAIDTAHNRIAARRLSDGVRAIFASAYVRAYVTYGYAVTVPSAQGVTADTTHAVLSETTSRPMLYVAMTPGRESNKAYLYERATEASECTHDRPDGAHQLMRRGDNHTTAHMMRTIIATEGPAQMAHDVAARTDAEDLPARVASLLIERRRQSVQSRRAEYRRWQAQQRQLQANRDRDIDQYRSRAREKSADYSLDL